MKQRQSASRATARASAAGRLVGPVSGAKVMVDFGRRPTRGTVVRTMITGRYTVELEVPGVDEPVIAVFGQDDLTPA